MITTNHRRGDDGSRRRHPRSWSKSRGAEVAGSSHQLVAPWTRAVRSGSARLGTKGDLRSRSAAPHGGVYIAVQGHLRAHLFSSRGRSEGRASICRQRSLQHGLAPPNSHRGGPANLPVANNHGPGAGDQVQTCRAFRCGCPAVGVESDPRVSRGDVDRDHANDKSASPRDSNFVVGTKDGAEPSIETASDPGAVPGGSTKAAPAKCSGAIVTPHRLERQIARRIHAGAVSAGPNQDRWRSDDRSCTREETDVTGQNRKCERQHVRVSGPAPRGVRLERSPGVLGNRNPHSISSVVGEVALP